MLNISSENKENIAQSHQTKVKSGNESVSTKPASKDASLEVQGRKITKTIGELYYSFSMFSYLANAIIKVLLNVVLNYPVARSPQMTS